MAFYQDSTTLTAVRPGLAILVGTFLAEGFVLAAIAGVTGTWAVRSLLGRSDLVAR